MLFAPTPSIYNIPKVLIHILKQEISGSSDRLPALNYYSKNFFFSISPAVAVNFLTMEANEEYFVIVLQRGGYDVTCKRSVVYLKGSNFKIRLPREDWNRVVS